MRWAMDSKSMKEDARGFKHILVVIDMFARCTFLRALKTVTAEETVEVLEELILSEGTSGLKEIWHDPGTQFMNSEVAGLLARFNIQQKPTVTAWKQQNGMVERCIRSMREQLATVQKDLNRTIWSTALAQTQFNINNAIHSAIGVAPWRIREGDEEAKATAREAILKRRRCEEKTAVAQEPPFVAGDWILRKIESREKLAEDQHRWHGPYRVLACSNNVVHYVNNGDAHVETFVGNVKKFTHREGEIVEMRTATEDIFVVEKILDHFPKKKSLKIEEIVLEVVYE